MKKISVIVPVYNQEKYIDICINSILSQTYSNIELIIVNDGSTDTSKEIISKYLQHPNIIYLEKENGGLSSSRNYGLKYATGDYISFVDSDDYIDSTLFESLSSQLNTIPDLIKFKMKIVSNNSIVAKCNGPVFDSIKGEEAFSKLYTQDNFLEVSCLYLYNKNFFMKNNFHFAEGLYHEDFGLIPLMLLKAANVISVPIYGYNYLQTNNSITRDSDYVKTLKKAYDLLAHYDNMIKTVACYNISNISVQNIKEYYSNSIITKTKELNNFNKKQYIKEIKKKKLIKNIRIINLKSLFKKIILKINIKLYLALKKFD